MALNDKQQKTRVAVGNAQSEHKVTTTQKPGVYFSEELLSEILERVACGENIYNICDQPGYPTRRSFFRWVINDAQIREKYEFALTARQHAMAEEIVHISDSPVGSLESGATDSGAVQKQRLQVDTRKWILSKLVPKKYGDKITQEVTGSDGGPVQQVVLTAADYKAARVEMLKSDDV